MSAVNFLHSLKDGAGNDLPEICNFNSKADILTRIQAIDAIANNDLEEQRRLKIIEILRFLSQAYSSQGVHVGETVSFLTNRAVELAKVIKNSNQIIDQTIFSYNPHLKELLKKISYLSSTLCGSRFISRFYHHLKMELIDNRSQAVAYIALGGSLVSTSYMDLSKNNARVLFNTGLGIAVYPLLNAIKLARAEEP